MLRVKTLEHRYFYKSNEESMANDKTRKQLLYIANTSNTSAQIKLEGRSYEIWIEGDFYGSGLFKRVQ